MTGNFNTIDRKYMQLALSLATKGRRKVSPNPLVGCVIVKDGVIAGLGYHGYFGGPHAEVVAIKNADTKAAGSTMYVTLEPCDHIGKTPPCTRAIIAAKVARVVVATLDPDSKVRGNGVRRLRKHGIQVNVGLLGEQARKVNSAYVRSRKIDRPFVMVKAAMSADGKIATRTGDSKWITSDRSRVWVHKLRSNVDAVVVGAGTAIHDNPHLTSHGAGRNPVRVILDPHLKTPFSHHVFDGQTPTIVFYRKSMVSRRVETLRRSKIMTVPLTMRDDRFDMREVISKLRTFSLNRILIEGGGETIASALEAGVVTDVAFFVAPAVIGGREAKTSVEGWGVDKVHKAVRLRKVKAKKIGRDILITAKIG